MEKTLFYDFEEVKAVPLEDICRDLYGIDLKQRGHKLVGRIRPEDNTPSFEIDTEKNLWYDYGLSKGGSAIQLVQQMDNVTWQEACRTIGSHFGLNPINSSRSQEWLPLSNSQYERLGISADMVSKNIDFDLEKYSPEQAMKLSEMFSNITIQKLAFQRPKSYHQILQRKAVPLVYEQKQEYLKLLAETAKAKQLHGENSLSYKTIRGACENAHKSYKELYDLLKRAIQGKAILVGKLNVYDVDTDLNRMINGEIQYESGTVRYNELKASLKEGEELKYLTVNDEELEKLTEKNIPFACFSKMGENKVCVNSENFLNALSAMERKYRTEENEVTTDKAKNTKASQTENKPETVQEKSAEQQNLYYFSELPESRQNEILKIWYDSKLKKLTENGKADEIKPIEEYREIFMKNKGFKYDESLNAHRVSKSIIKYGTVDYAEIKANSPLYLTFNNIDSKMLFAKLEAQKFPFSARVIGDNVKITIPKDRKEQFEKIKAACLHRNAMTM